MKVIRYDFVIEGRSGEFWFDIFADTHLGSLSVAETMLKRDIKRTADSGHYAVHLGDAIDGITPGDCRYDPQNMTRWAREAELDNRLIAAEWEYFEKLFSPIQDKLLFVLDGDGKHNVCENVENCMQRTLTAMGVAGGFPTAHCLFSFKRKGSATTKRVELIFQHMGATGRTDEAKSRYCKNVLAYYPTATGFFCGHGHGKVSCRSECLAIEGSEQITWVRRAAQCGSYLMTYAQDTIGYGERKAFPPAALGNVVVCLRPFSYDYDKRIELFNM